jgi:3-oxoadipate enol-lactonase/4-carboxymuconolactone decarboxylase
MEGHSMLSVTHAGARLSWMDEGARAQPPILLLNSIGTDLGSWDEVVPLLLPHFRVLRMDTRGHGGSDAPAGEYGLRLLAADALAVLDAAGVDAAIVCGVSLGGMIGMALAVETPDRVQALIAACTSPKMDADAWRARIAAVQSGGMAAIAEAALQRYFSPGFSDQRPEVVERFRAALLGQSPAGYAACGAAIRDMDLRQDLAAITAPTLVIGGLGDVSTPFPAHGELIAKGVPGAQAVQLDAAHLAQVEAPSDFAATVLAFAGRPAR